MVVLKKVKAATLMETLVATVLLIVVFMMASLTINTLFGNTVRYNTRGVNTRLHQLQYQYQNRQLVLPHMEEYNNWNITISGSPENETLYISFEATHRQTQKTIEKTRIAHGQKH